MSEIKTITVTSTEQEITLDATYQFVWFRNLGDNDCYVSDHSGIIAGADDVALCKAGECVRITLPQAPMSNKAYIKAVDGSNTVEIHAQNFSDKPTAKTGKGSGVVVEALTVDTNGVYTAPTGKAYSPVTVDVVEQPWQPLQDGYSNFWFELTNDTLSPWLNFSAKNNDAVIDWGDGSGEVALDTLTPTHTYSKAGKYVVKVKGVTGIWRQFPQPYNGKYFPVLRYAELADEVTTINESGFQYCSSLMHISFPDITVLNKSLFQSCASLNKISIPNTVTTIQQGAFYSVYSLESITIPSSVTNIGNNAFYYSISLNEIHIQATTPPTLGTNAFLGLRSDYVIYVPVGTGDTYKAASGWSTYADHIVEEGSRLTRAQLRNIELENTKKGSDDEWQR